MPVSTGAVSQQLPIPFPAAVSSMFSMAAPMLWAMVDSDFG